jgi:hypothetical protein
LRPKINRKLIEQRWAEDIEAEIGQRYYRSALIEAAEHYKIATVNQKVERRAVEDYNSIFRSSDSK